MSSMWAGLSSWIIQRELACWAAPFLGDAMRSHLIVGFVGCVLRNREAMLQGGRGGYYELHNDASLSSLWRH